MSRRSSSAPLVALAILAALAAVVYIVVGRGSEEPPGKNTPEPAGQVRATTPGGPAEAPPKPTTGDRASVRKLANREARDRLLRAIAQARARRTKGDWNANNSSSRPPPALKPPPLDRKYIQATMRGVLGLLKECYELAAADNAELAGRLVVKFEIEGEPEVGGIVSTAEVEKGEDSPLGNHASLSECVRETVMSLEFEPPANGGKVVVRYPFLFRGQP